MLRLNQKFLSYGINFDQFKKMVILFSYQFIQQGIIVIVRSSKFHSYGAKKITKAISRHFSYRGCLNSSFIIFTETQQFPKWAIVWRPHDYYTHCFLTTEQAPNYQYSMAPLICIIKYKEGVFQKLLYLLLYHSPICDLSTLHIIL